MKPLARWTIGPVSPAGFQCLQRSIESFLRFHDVEVVICSNCDGNLPDVFSRYRLIDQRAFVGDRTPLGVAWKLYPPRVAPNRHEIVIDNDIVFESQIPEIEQFLTGDCTLLLQGSGRNYGRFDRHVPPDREINSGIYGMPPGFDLEKFVEFHAGVAWEENATGDHKQSGTFDEQGLVALALLSYHAFTIISNETITNCEHALRIAPGMHFIGLNRKQFHRPFELYKSLKRKMYL